MRVAEPKESSIRVSHDGKWRRKWVIVGDEKKLAGVTVTLKVKGTPDKTESIALLVNVGAGGGWPPPYVVVVKICCAWGAGL